MSKAIAQFFRQRRTLSSGNVLAFPEEEQLHQDPRSSPAGSIKTMTSRVDEANSTWRVSRYDSVSIQEGNYPERESNRYKEQLDITK